MYNLGHIRYLAEKKNLKIKDIILHAGITDAGLRNSIENQSINLKALDRLADLFGCSISECINDTRLTIPYAEGRPADHEDIFRKLVATQEELIRKQEKLYFSLEKENKELLKQVEKLKNELQLLRGYGMAAEPPPPKIRKNKQSKI